MRRHNQGLVLVRGGSRRHNQGGVAVIPTVAPVNTTLPAIFGTPTVGETLTASHGAWSNSPTSYAYQWYADAGSIAGAMAASYELTGTEEGAEITVGVVATNVVGPSSEGLSAAVGPVAAAPDVMAPTITSAAPSGEYDEGVAISGTLTADESVTWSKSGVDAATVTLDPDTGVWSLEATDYETKTSYRWTFTATDGAGNTTDQIVAITIADVADTTLVAPVLTQTSDAGTWPMTWDSDLEDPIVDVTTIGMQWRVNGGAWTVEDDHVFTSDDAFDWESGDLAFDWPLFAAYEPSDGDFIEVQEIRKEAGSADAPSDILSDTMEIAVSASYSHGGLVTFATSNTSHTYTSLAFGEGIAVIAITCYSNAGGTTSSVPSSVTLTPTGGGSAISATLRGSGGRAASRVFAIYAAPIASAGNYDVAIVRPSAARSNVLCYGTLSGTAVPIAGPTFTSASETNPHATASLTCPADGLILGWLMTENSATLAANSGTTLIDQTFFNGECGLVLGTRADTGSISFSATPNSTFNWGRGVVAFAP